MLAAAERDFPTILHFRIITSSSALNQGIGVWDKLGTISYMYTRLAIFEETKFLINFIFCSIVSLSVRILVISSSL